MKRPEEDRLSQSIKFDFEMQRFDGLGALQQQRFWIEAPLTSEVRRTLLRRNGCKGWNVRLLGVREPCGLIVMFYGFSYEWPYGRKHEIPLTRPPNERSMAWTDNLLIVADGVPEMINGSQLSHARFVLAERLANRPGPAILSRQDAEDLAKLF